MIAATAARIPVPRRVAHDLEPRRQTIRAGLGGVERERIISTAKIRHRIGLVIIVVVTRHQIVAVRRDDAVLDTVAVRIQRRAVTAVQVGKDFHVRHRAAVRREEQRDRRGIIVQLVHEDVRRRVIRVYTVHRQHRRASDVVADGKGERTRRRRVRCAGRGAARVIAVEPGVCHAAETVEGQQEKILHRVAAAENAAGQRRLPVLVRARVRVERKIGAAPRALRRRLEIERAARLIAELGRAVVFPDARVKLHRRVRADGRLGIPHVEAEIARVVRDMPARRERGVGAEIKVHQRDGNQHCRRSQTGKKTVHKIKFGLSQDSEGQRPCPLSQSVCPKPTRASALHPHGNWIT